MIIMLKMMMNYMNIQKYDIDIENLEDPKAEEEEEEMRKILKK